MMATWVIPWLGNGVNMGADSNTSNLKTNYGLIYLEDWNSRQAYDIGFQFFGSVIGDHSKTAINAMLNTGTMCGVCSNIFLSQFTPKHIPSLVGSRMLEIVPIDLIKPWKP